MSAFWIAIIATIAIPIAIVLGAMSVIANMKKSVHGNVSVAVTPSRSWWSRHPILTTIIIVTVVIFSGTILITYGQGMLEWATSVWWALPFVLGAIIATHAWYKHGAGKGGLFFLYLFGAALFATLVGLMIFGPDGTIKAYSQFQQGANETMENGISFDSGPTSRSARAPVGPLRLQAGNLLVLNRGESRHVLVTGKVSVPVRESGYCINMTPDDGTIMTWSDPPTMVWIEPRRRSAELVVTKHNDC